MELLIVIGVLGILAAGLLAAIDPFEQLKKARDTNNRSAAIELLQSSQRYYANHGYLPWYKPGLVAGSYDTSCPDATWANLRPATAVVDFTNPNDIIEVTEEDKVGLTDVYNCINDTLGDDGEIKGTFFDGLATSLYLASGSKSRAVVCFAPEAKSNISDAQTQYSIDSLTTPTVVDGDCSDVERPTGVCVQCFQ